MATDVMIDLETTGTGAGCCVLSIGAVSLDLKHEFYERISWANSKAFGLVDNPNTMAWWQKQSVQAREEAFSGERPLLEVLGAFSDWLAMVQRLEGDVFVWGNGADFDLPILGHLYDRFSMKKPWKPFNGRCYRTVKNLPKAKEIKEDEFLGLKHNALEDARHQARHLMKIIKAGVI